ncbi:hypothetical protein GCM10009775_02440 [Microbacterium aoyamense]|uniref:DUF2017 domain-containing protein n=1 Tax=Microbacterium aoyamense TaxID=344166 RepID=A0ABN2P6F2_9MICO|nr:DUF2017 family protein [Microbacterium aoyamense]
MTPETIVLELARIEAAHLAGLVVQFDELLDESADSGDDPAVLRLVPDAYEDPEAAREFREVTESDLLGRRRSDAARVLATLGHVGELGDDLDDPAFVEQVSIVLDREDVQAWLRTLAAIRLVLATRLGIVNDDEHDHDDPKYGIYDWLGYRLDGLVGALDA